MKWQWPWQRWAEARDRAHHAEEEMERSRELLSKTTRTLKPLEEIHQRNQFSDMIREALRTGYPPPPQRSHQARQGRA